MNQKGFGIIQMLLVLISSIIVFYAWLQIYVPLYDDYLDPILDNVAHGAVIRILVQFMPLFAAISIMAIPIVYLGGGGRPSYPPQ